MEYGIWPISQPFSGKFAYSTAPASGPKSVPYLHIDPSSVTPTGLWAVLHAPNHSPTH